MGCVQSSSPNSYLTQQRKQQIQRMKKQLAKKNNEISLLQKQNNELKRKKIEKIQQKQQGLKQNDISIIRFQQDGKDQNVRDAQTQLRQLLKCTLCQEQYNLRDRIPWMVCVNQHTYCNDCICRMLTRNQDKCPQCRQTVTGGNRNLHLCLLLQNTKKKDANNNTIFKFSNSVQELNISVNKQNRYYNQYQFFAPNAIVKRQDQGWYGLLFNQVIPAEGRFKFCMQVVFSLHNNIQIGIIDISSKVEKGKMSNKRISFHLYDGKVMDSGNVDTPVTAWRQLSQPVPNNNSKIVVQVDMDNNKISWTINDKLHAQTVVTNYLKYAKAVPYLSMYHTDDIVNINTW